MADYNAGLAGKVALVTGGARRVGAGIVRHLHARGMNIALHYRHSLEQAEALAAELNALRPDSVYLLHAELLHLDLLHNMVDGVLDRSGRLDALVNNASSFFPSPMGGVTEAQWDDLMGTNLRAPFFLAQAATPHLAACDGCIVNIADIHGFRPLKGYPVYSMAKAGLIMLTHALARELGPSVRVNGVAPGAILWPEDGLDEVTRQRVVARTALKRRGTPEDIARTVGFLVADATYVTGEVISVDGGRMLGGS